MKLLSARKSAGSIRFKADKSILGGIDDAASAVAHKDQLLRSGLAVSASLTPTVFETLDAVCGRLHVPTNCVSAFIFADPHYQASCISSGPKQCLLQFSSALVNSLDSEELGFVIGHEIGHFLLEHRGMSANDLAPESFLLNRAQEISADRLGLIGAGNLNSALRALMKTVSGLENRLLRFEVGQFLSQISSLDEPSIGENINNTHPSMLIRARAIIWFSSQVDFGIYPKGISSKDILTVDKNVQEDLDKYVDASFNNRVLSIKSDVAMWLSALKILDDGKVDTSEQEKFRNLFGPDMLSKLTNFLDDNGAQEARNLAQNNLAQCREQLEGIIPSSFQDEYLTVVKKIDRLFSD
jgi:hypothetical protein